MSELISVIVPIYNVESYLERCVDSIIKQTYKNLQIILVDDGSTDKSGEICDKYASIDNRIVVIHKKNGGLSDARNYGIERATGRYIGFIDSDDYINPEMYSFLYRLINKNKADIAIGGTCKVYENDNEILKYNNQVVEMIMDKDESLSVLNSFSYFDMSVCDKLYKIELFNNIKFPVGKKCEDFYTLFKVFNNTTKVVYNSTSLYYYYQRPNSISRNNIVEFSYIEASDYQLQYFRKNIKHLESVAQVACVFSRIATYNKYLDYNIVCPKDIKRRFKIYVKKNLLNVFTNPYIKLRKKIQVFLFSFNLFSYELLYRQLKK